MKKIILFLPLIIFANVFVKVNKNKIFKGEEVVITITAEGRNVKFPDISNIDGYSIIGSSTSTNLIIINGKAKESVSKSFIIYPDKNLTIPSFKVEVDGKIYKTKPIFIEVVTPKQSIGDFILEVNLSKNRVYLGESVILDIKFKYKKKFYSINIIPPKIENFIFKKLSQANKNKEIDAKFLLIPQKSGDYKLQFRADVGFLVEVKDPFFYDGFFSMKDIKYKTIFSNIVNLKVLPIQKNAIYGDFNISIKAKNRVKENEVNKVVLTIKGCGDFANIKDFKLNISNATVYEKKPIIKTEVKNNKICGIYQKEFDVIADNNYTIPSFVLKELNKTISTKPIKVEVESQKKEIGSINENIHSKKEINYLYLLLSFISGILISIAGYFLLKREKSLISKIKGANDKELFNLLLPYKEDIRIKRILEKLEENIYKHKNHKIDKKEIIKIIKEKSRL